MSDEKFQAETRARSRQTRAVNAGREQIELGLGVLKRALEGAFNDGGPCFFCNGTGRVMWAVAHEGACRECGGTGVFSPEHPQPLVFGGVSKSTHTAQEEK